MPSASSPDGSNFNPGGMEPGLRGIIFDLDGTLVDSEPFHLLAWNEIVLAHGGSPNPGWNDDTVGHPDSVAAEKTLRLYPELAGQSVAGLMEEKDRIFRGFVRREGPKLLFPGVESALRAARAAGMPLAVGTNSIRVNAAATLDAAGIREFFATIVTIDRVARGKPEPDIYATAAAELGLPPENCAVIEDSAAGVRAGRAAGCVVLGVGPAARPGAEKVFSGLAGAVEWVLRKRGTTDASA